MRRSVMSMPEVILKREMSGSAMFLGSTMRSRITPSTRKRMRRSFFFGSMWMSEARSLIARRMSESPISTICFDFTSSESLASVRSALR
jgi:hypothetical protein